MGFVDDDGYNKIMDSTMLTKSELDAGHFVNATNLWGRTESVILTVTRGIDFYNVLRTQSYSERTIAKQLNLNDENSLRTLEILQYIFILIKKNHL